MPTRPNQEYVRVKSPRDLKNQVAVVTGSSAGIGLATARYLASLGASVVMNARDPEKLQAACDDVSQSGTLVRAVVGDIRSEVTRADLLSTAMALGGVHILVANAGGGQQGMSVEHLTVEKVISSYEFNVACTADLIRLVAPAMKKQAYGRIVTVSSLAGRRYGRLAGPDYSAAKAGLIGLTRHLASDLAPFGITVNCVAPGLIKTNRAEQMSEALSPDAKQILDSTTPLGRWGEPEEVAAAIAFLACPEASFITGATIDVNGGAFMA